MISSHVLLTIFSPILLLTAFLDLSAVVGALVPVELDSGVPFPRQQINSAFSQNFPARRADGDSICAECLHRVKVLARKSVELARPLGQLMMAVGQRWSHRLKQCRGSCRDAVATNEQRYRRLGSYRHEDYVLNFDDQDPAEIREAAASASARFSVGNTDGSWIGRLSGGGIDGSQNQGQRPFEFQPSPPLHPRIASICREEATERV